MNERKQFVVVGIPPMYRSVIGEDNLGRLTQAHPRARVEITDAPLRFAGLLPEADGVLVGPGFPLQATALRPDGRLRWVHSLPAGADAILTPDLVAAAHVAITATKGPMAPMMAEHAALLMLALARDLPGILRDQAAHRWGAAQGQRRVGQLFGKTICVLGVGAVGGRLAGVCKIGFGMRVLGLARTRRDCPYVDRYIERDELSAALGEADVVALCLALTAATEHIIDADALEAMKPGALLINVARGRLVDEDALIGALRAGRLGGAGLDATVVEPLPPESPLWTLPNVIITPHIAPARDRFNVQMADFWRENIRRFAEGEPLLGAVDRQAGY